MNRLTVFLLCLVITSAFSQTDSNFDSIFSQWNDKNIPGVVAGIIENDKIIYLKGFGLADIETKRRITPQTKFQLGELSKQFTTLAILLLEKQGKISLNDDIRKYLTELPEYTHTITINHLLNHSSGLYDINRINNLIHGSLNVYTRKEAIKLIASQKDLAFKPGTDFSFHESVTESVLMAEIVAKSSGQSFANFIKTNIFEPIGMKNSIIRDDSNTIISNVAQPYQKDKNNDYKKHEVNSSVIGAINAYSTAEDLAIWYMNFTNPKGELGNLIQKLNSPVQLSSGKKFVYYWGEMAIGREFTHPERGLPIFWNYGFQGAYGTNVFRYLDQNITAFVLGNNNQYNGALAQNLINLLVKDKYPLPATIDFTTKKIKKLNTKALKSFEGHYWFKEGYASEIFVKNDTLRTKWLFGERYQTLIPLSDNTFQQYAKMEDTRFFKFKKEGKNMTLYFTYNESRPDIMERYEPVNPSGQDLLEYIGTYYNEEYGSLFTFQVEDEQLTAKNLSHLDVNFKSVKKDIFTSTSMFFNAITFFRDKAGMITGFSMITDGIRNLNFTKSTTHKKDQRLNN